MILGKNYFNGIENDKVYLGSNLIYSKESDASGYVLDTYAYPSVAYSLRKLSSSTTNVIRVRRFSDNAEQDFTSVQITDGTLTTFTGTSHGYVSTWYDQSGNGNHATQSTALEQPRIVSNGVVELQNGKPSLYYAGSHHLNVNSPISDARSIFMTVKLNFNHYNDSLLGHFTAYDYHGITTNNILDTYSSNFVKNGGNYVNGVSKNFLTTSLGSSQSLVTMIHTSSSGKIGQISKDRHYSIRGLRGHLQELIVYSTDQSTNRGAIENDINNEYTIY